MAEINLLPKASQEQQSVSKVAVISKKIGIIASVVLLFGMIIYASVYGFFFINKNLTATTTEELETQIKAQESVEQKIVLLRDRAIKTAKIMEADSASGEVTSFLNLNTRLPAGVTIKETKLFPSEYKVSIQADESKQISEFIRVIKESGAYAQVESMSLDFSPKDRYIAEFRFVIIPPQTQL